MSIKSYLAHSKTGKKKHLIEAISKLEQCEVIPAKNEDILIVVTETENEIQEGNLKEKLAGIDSLKLLVMVSGFNSQKNQ